MKKEDKIRSLTWKYFWQQKWEEIYGVFSWIFNVCFEAFLIFGWIPPLAVIISRLVGTDCTIPGNCPGPIYILVINIIGIIWLVCFIIFMIKLFIKWIKSNWKKAEFRASEVEDILE